MDGEQTARCVVCGVENPWRPCSQVIRTQNVDGKAAPVIVPRAESTKPMLHWRDGAHAVLCATHEVDDFVQAVRLHGKAAFNLRVDDRLVADDIDVL